ncbi:MAG: hypothetical protein H6741_35080 [Alphaproteobacteria bacterium]|nr:hypothetical protein [Alphaproteobacteria bacterium]
MARLPSPILCAVPDAEHEARFKRVIGLLAEGFADLLIADARAEVAERLGVDEASLDRERDQPELDTKPGAWLGQLEVA